MMLANTVPHVSIAEALATLEFPASGYIDGQWARSARSPEFRPVHPASGVTLPGIAEADHVLVDLAVAAARRAFDGGRWHALSPLTRQDLMRRFADLVMSKQEELALFDTLEMGKPIVDARADVSVASGLLRFFAEAIDKVEGAVMSADSRTLALSRPEPRGVVGAITPWNFPVINAMLKIAPAMAAGNCMVLKPSELASYSTLRLAELAVEAGIPAGVLNVVPGFGDPVGATIGSHPGIDMVSFTGSTATGRRLMAASANSNAKPLLLECGGKSPVIVFADMRDRLETIAVAIAKGFLWNSGQVCVARTRLLVEASIHDDLVAAIVAQVDRVAMVDPLSGSEGIGPLASFAQQKRVLECISAAEAAGARPVTLRRTVPKQGAYVTPIVFDRVTSEMAIAQEEIFGPVLTVQPFDTLKQAISLANDTPYGLAATIWTRDLQRAITATRDIRAGKVVVLGGAPAGEGAGFALGSEPWNQSGFGIESGVAGLKSYSRVKAIEIVI